MTPTHLKTTETGLDNFLLSLVPISVTRSAFLVSYSITRCDSLLPLQKEVLLIMPYIYSKYRMELALLIL